MATITPLPIPPVRGDAPEDFSTKADTFLAAIPPFATETNAVRDEVVQLKSDTQDIKDDAVTETTNIKDDAVTDTTNIKDATQGIHDATVIVHDDVISLKNTTLNARDEALQAAVDTAADRVQTGIDRANLTEAVDSAAASAVTATTKADEASTSAEEAAISAAGISDGPVTSVNGLTGVVDLPIGIDTIAYDNRDTLRTMTPTAGDAKIVEGLGLFSWYEASTEPDDDESAFATTTGVWLLTAAHWDLVDTWQLPDDEARDAFDEDEPIRFAESFAESFAEKILYGTATCAISSVAATNSAAFTGTVSGANVGDRVIATPPAELGSTSAYSGRLGYHAYVSANDTITIKLTNASAATATVNSAVRTDWSIAIIKEI